MHHRNSCRFERVSLNRGRLWDSEDIDTKIRRRSFYVLSRSLANNKRAAIKLVPGCLEWFLGSINGGILQTKAQRHECVVGVVIYQVNRTATGDIADRAHVTGDAVRRRGQDLDRKSTRLNSSHRCISY